MKTVLLFAVFCILTGSTVGVGFCAGGPNDAGDSEVISDIREWAQSGGTTWFSANQKKVTPALAAAADALGMRSSEAGHLKDAFYAYAFASLAHRQLGEFGQELQSWLHGQEVSFYTASTPSEYLKVRTKALTVQSSADSMKRSDIGFEAGVLASDCSFFASSANGRYPDDKLLFLALQDAASTLPRVQFAGDNRLSLERFVDLLGGLVNQALSSSFLSEDPNSVQSTLRRIANGIESFVPVDFEYSDSRIGDRSKSVAQAASFAWLSYKFGDPLGATKRLSVAASRAKMMKDHYTWLSLTVERYQVERDAGFPRQELDAISSSAWNAADDLRVGYRSRAGRIWAGYQADRLYGELLRDELSRKSLDGSVTFARVESLKSRTTLDEMTFPRVGVDLPTGGLGLEQQVLGFNQSTKDSDDLMLSEMRLVSQLSGFAELEDEGIFRQKALAKLEDLYRRDGRGFTKVASPATLKEVEQALKPREAILEYVIPYHPLNPAQDLWIIWITRTEMKIIHVELSKLLPLTGRGRLSVGGAWVDQSPLDLLVVSIRTAIESSNDDKARLLLRTLYSILVEPITSEGIRLSDFDQINVIPQGMLHYVPFAALLDDDSKFLISKTALTISPSASVWLALTKREGPVRRFAGFADPVLNQRGLPPLRFASGEIRGVAAGLPTLEQRVEVGAKATKERFFSDAPWSNILHITSHGEFPDENAIDRHAVLLSPAPGSDGVLRASSVRLLDLSSTKLVVLSVCDGALYRVGPADEPYGLVPAFQQAGVQNVMGSLWAIDDQSARDFMKEFYSHLLEIGPARAYRKAAQLFISNDELIKDWAGFVVAGPGRKFGSLPN